MDAVDSYIPNPDREEDKPFLMPIEDVKMCIRDRRKSHIFCRKLPKRKNLE